MRELEVDLGARRYPIRIGAGLLDTGTDWQEVLPGRHVLIVSDRNVAPLYLARVEKALAGKTVGTLILPAGEQEKSGLDKELTQCSNGDNSSVIEISFTGALPSF